MRRVNYDRELLARWVDETGETDEQFSRRAGISRMSLHRARTRYVDLHTLGMIASATGHTLAELLTPDTANRFAIHATIS